MLYVMLALRAIIPLLYVFVTAGAVNLLSGKGFVRSLAPAFFSQIILMLISAMAFGSINLGIIIWIICCLSVWVVSAVRKRLANVTTGSDAKPIIGVFKGALGTYEDIIFVVIVYLVIWTSNFSKVYDFWDEYSHWGPFVKEMLHLDRLFCDSPLQLAHKDYVPAPSLFETLWCRLMLGYSEPNAYRAVQMLQVSMFMPVCFEREHSRYDRYIRLIAISSIPLLFTTEYYHTVVPDLLLGVLIFYSMWIVISGSEGIYDLFVLAVSLTVMVLTKQTAIAFLPMVVIFCLVYRRMKAARLLIYAPVLSIVPIVVWRVFNIYSTHAIGLTGGANGGEQSYGSLSISQMFRTVFHIEYLPLQDEFDAIYLKALFTKPVMGPLSYASALALVIAFLIVWAVLRRSDSDIRRGVFWVTLWIVLAAITYAVLMYYLYVVTFGLDYARKLSSYERYMATFLLAAYVLAYAFISSRSTGFLKETVFSAVVCAVFVLSAILIFNIDQVFPGNMSLGALVQMDERRCEYDVWKLTEAEIPEDASVFVLTRGSSSEDTVLIAYLMSPMIISGGSFGPECDETDKYSRDITPSEFVDWMSPYDYIYFRYIDDVFVDKYGEAFGNPDIIEEYTVYKMEVADNHIQLSR